jgi:site-specific DNA-methyltransferase (adenine-specific)
MSAITSVDGLKYRWTLSYLTPGQSVQVQGLGVISNWKPIIWLVKGKNSWERVEDSFTSDKNDKQFHEWGQSVGGMAQVVERFTVPKAIVVDPFVGGGATAVAAVMLDRFFVGADIEKSCVAQTGSRLKDICGEL